MRLRIAIFSSASPTLRRSAPSLCVARRLYGCNVAARTFAATTPACSVDPCTILDSAVGVPTPSNKGSELRLASATKRALIACVALISVVLKWLDLTRVNRVVIGFVADRHSFATGD